MKTLVILLHGVGSNGADLVPLGDAWRAALPQAEFVAPDAPSAQGAGPGRQWFSVAGVTAANRAERVVAARGPFDATLSRIIADHGLSDDLDRVALVGFSQGSIMALDALATGRWPVAGMVAFAGRLATPPPLQPSTGTPALLIHGDRDGVIPAGESEAAAASLRGLGVRIGVRILPGVAHTISAEGASLAEAFLVKVLA